MGLLWPEFGCAWSQSWPIVQTLLQLGHNRRELAALPTCLSDSTTTKPAGAERYPIPLNLLLWPNICRTLSQSPPIVRTFPPLGHNSRKVGLTSPLASQDNKAEPIFSPVRLRLLLVGPLFNQKPGFGEGIDRGLQVVFGVCFDGVKVDAIG
ncbi:hypothetical protein ALCH109712_05670 [Alkalicoccus chagannorensis]